MPDARFAIAPLHLSMPVYRLLMMLLRCYNEQCQPVLSAI